MLLATHMTELSKAVVFPEHHGDLLRSLRKRHRLAVVSNFDYTPTAWHVLEREGVADLFETVVVSDEVGWRKPKPVIFELALERHGHGSRRRAVRRRPGGHRRGGRPGRGHGRGLDQPGPRASCPRGMPAPEFEIRDLAELERILAK